MGLIRVLLAISVVIAHSSKVFGFGLVGGQIAVQAFYIISGFYMTLILKEKYIGKNDSYKLFISNRLLRLYPIYWTVFLLTILLSLVIFLYSSGNSLGRLQPYYDNIHSMNFGSIFFLILSNIIMFFQDIVMFLGIDITSGELFFTTNFRNTSPPLYSFLIVPQAWTIGVEITFYLVAPFIVRKNIWFVSTLILVSLLLRVVLYRYGLNHDPWTYRFFPTELLFFLLGTVAYHFYKKITGLNLKKLHLKMIYFSIVIFTIFYSWFPIPYKMYIYFIFFFISIPFVFILSKNWTKDRYIGELSYPIYISHIFILTLVNRMNIHQEVGLGFVTITCSIFFSILLNELIAKKIEKIRQSRVKPSARNVYKQ